MRGIMSLPTPVELHKPLIQRLAEFIVPGDTTDLTHGLHPYPAKYIPQLPRAVILDHTNERNTVLDPFCGSGTTLVEACRFGRKSIGIDSNPVATLISRVKTRALTESEIGEVRRVLTLVLEVKQPANLPKHPIPAIPRIEHWFQPNVLRELAWLKHLALSLSNERAREFVLCIFSSIIVPVSNQESETRYAAIEKNLADGYVLRRFARKLADSIPRIVELADIDRARRNPATVYTMDSTDLGESVLPDKSVDLVVTSPPYPNSYDYYLYHKMRMYWLGYDPREAQASEIGSRHEHSSKKAPVEVFEHRMLPILKNIHRVLKPSKLAYFFVGDSVISGKQIDMGEVFRRIGRAAGFGFLAGTEYSLDLVTRSFHEKKWSSNRNPRSKMQRVVVFEGRTDKDRVFVTDRAIASPKPVRKSIPLEGEVRNGATIAIQSQDFDRHIHSLGKFPSKFIPELPRWAIRRFSDLDDTVLDPFAGCGTTAIECLLNSRSAISIDFSPYACLLARAKTTRVPFRELDTYAGMIQKVLEHPARLPKRERMSFEWDTFWFNPAHLTQFEQIRSFIEEETPESVRSFFLAILSTTIKNFSYLDESQIKVKRDPRKVLSGTRSPVELLKPRLGVFAARLKEFIERADPEANHHVINASALDLWKLGIRSNSVDLIVTSPPYINAMNYPMTHRYENLLLGLVPVSGMIDHQRGYFGSERVYAEDYSVFRPVDVPARIADSFNPRLRKIFEREPKRAYIASEYFRNMYRSLKDCADVLKRGGKFVLIAGSNVIRDVPIDTFQILVTMLEDLGLTRRTTFHYEIIKQAFKLLRHSTANLIKMDGVSVLEKP